MSAQITPLYNPNGNTYIAANGDFNAETYGNGGILEIQGSTSFSNSGTINNNEDARINNFGSFDIKSGGIINNEFNAYFNSTNSVTNEGTFNNSGQMDVSGFTNNGGAVLNNYSGSGDNGVINLSGYSTNKGSIANYGIINIADALFNEGSIIGTGQINGDVVGGGDFSPGASAGGFLVNGFLTLSEGSTKFIELAGDCDANRDRVNTEHDFLDVTGDLILDGGKLDVKSIEGFELRADQAFVIAKVGGDIEGEFTGLENGALVGEFNAIGGGMIDLFISYDYFEGEITLFTK